MLLGNKKTFMVLVLLVVMLLSGCQYISSMNPQKSIEFNTNFGTPVDMIVGLPGTAVTQPADPTREHYQFGGWYIDRDLTTPYVFDTMPTESITLYAKWNGTIVQTPEGLLLLLKDDGMYGVAGYVGTNPNVVVPETYNGITITSIEILAFEHNQVIEEILLPSTITLIRHGAFYGVDSLPYIQIPNSVVELEGYLFDNAQSLRGIEFEQGSQLTVIGEAAFYGTSALLWVNIPASVTEIGPLAFADCYSLRNVTFESDTTLTHIGEAAFASTAISHLVLPSSVTHIGQSAFAPAYSQVSMHLYVRPQTRPTGWDEDWASGNVTVEWGTTRQVIVVTFAEPDGTVIMQYEAVSGTPWVEIIPDSVFDRFQGWYVDAALTTPLAWTVHPNASVTIYAKLSSN